MIRRTYADREEKGGRSRGPGWRDGAWRDGVTYSLPGGVTYRLLRTDLTS